MHPFQNPQRVKYNELRAAAFEKIAKVTKKYKMRQTVYRHELDEIERAMEAIQEMEAQFICNGKEEEDVEMNGEHVLNGLMNGVHN